jgi:hypothetical protein
MIERTADIFAGIDYVVEVSDEWSGATLTVRASSPAAARDYAVQAFAHDRRRAGGLLVDLRTLRWNVVGTGEQWEGAR